MYLRFAVLLHTAVSSVCAYFAHTHAYLGLMLTQHLDTFAPSALHTLQLQMQESDLAHASVWADSVKHDPHWSWMTPLHYIDIDTCGNQTTDSIAHACGNGCVASALEDLGTLGNARSPEQTKLLLHLCQDVTQPMHVYGPGRGGNDIHVVVVMPDGRHVQSNMHTLWDSIVPEYYTKHFTFDALQPVQRRRNKTRLIHDVVQRGVDIACRHSFSHRNNTVVFEDVFDRRTVETMFRDFLALAVALLTT